MAIAAPTAVKLTYLAISTSQPRKSTTVSTPGNLFLFDSHRRLIVRHRLFSGNSTTPITFQRQISSAASLPSDANVGELDLGENESSSQYIPQFDQKVDGFLDSLKWDDKGLVVAIAQNVDTGAIMMQGFANRDAIAKTIVSRKATFYSRSRSSLWTKGETSTNFIHVHDIFVDCDRDSVIYLGEPDGPTCHTGAETCYYLSVSDILRDRRATEYRLASTTLFSLENTISQRRDEAVTNGKPSWTKRLLNDTGLLCSKVREEAEELVQTLLQEEDGSRTVSEWQICSTMPWCFFLQGMRKWKRCLRSLGPDSPSQELRRRTVERKTLGSLRCSKLFKDYLMRMGHFDVVS